MRKEYFKALTNEYGYTANWAPSESVEVGDWTNLEAGFKPWLNRVLNNTTLDMEINDGLHNVMRCSLEKVAKTERKLAPMCLSYQVSIDAGISGGPAKIRATKAGGFFAIFQDIHEISAKPSSFQEKIHELDEEYVAIISSVTCVSKGFLVIFNEDTASFTLPIGFDYSLEQMLHKPDLINLDFDFKASYTNAGVIAFQAQSDKMLIPFVKIAKVKPHGELTGRALRQERNPALKKSAPRKSHPMAPQGVANRAPRSVQLTEKYDIQPFSYTDFFETMEL